MDIGVLVLGQEEGPGRVDREIARVLAQGWLVAGGGQLARGRVNLEDGDAVMAPVRSVDELARGVDLHLGRVALALEVLQAAS